MPTTTPRANPYIGPRAFQTGEKLFGRDYEIHELLNLLIAERIVLLHAPSGAGKTSLVQAGLLPELVEEGFLVLPVVRVNLPLPGNVTLPVGYNRYVYSTLASLEEHRPKAEQRPPEQLVCMSLPEYLADEKARQAKLSAADHQADGSVPNLALIFDQFEEILTVDPNDLAGKNTFFSQLGEVLRDRSRWALFSMREDYLAALSPYLRPLPTHLSNTYRLNFLDKDSAAEAIRQPAAQAGAEFEAIAAGKLVDDLRRVQMQQPDGSFRDELGPAIEPLQLQVVCYRLWESLTPDDKYIDEGDVQALGDVNASLSDYYDLRAAEIARDMSVAERRIRAWFQEKLITPGGIRGQVMLEQDRSGGLENAVIQQLINSHLVRSETRGGAIWFELSHDRLIKPVRESNQAWFESHLSLLQKQAALWDSQGRPEGMLLRGSELDQAEAWAKEHDADVTPVERRFLVDCRQELQREADTQQLREQSLRTEAERQRAEVEAQRAEAERQRAEAETQKAATERQRADEQAHANRRARRLVAIMVIVAMIALALAGLAYSSFTQATRAVSAANAAGTQENQQKNTAEAAGTLVNQQKNNAEVALTMIARNDATIAVSNTQAAAESALAVSDLKEARATAQAATAQAAVAPPLVYAFTATPAALPQQTAVVGSGGNPSAPGGGTTGGPPLRAQNENLSLQLGRVSMANIINRPDLALLLAVESFESGNTYNARNALLYNVQKGLASNGQSLALSLPFQTGPGVSLAFSPDGKTLAVSTNGDLTQWDVPTSLSGLDSRAPVSAAAPQDVPPGSAGEIYYDSSGSLNVLVDTAATVGASAGAPLAEGMDVSLYNGSIDWNQVKGNTAFVFIRATQGGQLLDRAFAQNWFGAQSIGILRGAYHYFSQTDDPVAQAKFFLDTVQPEPSDLPPVLDLGDAADPNIPARTIRASALKWLKYVEQQTGKMPIIYTSAIAAQSLGLFTDPAFADYPLWIANFTSGDQPNIGSTDRTWTFWQYTDKGQVPGVPQKADLNRFNGSIDDLRMLAYRSAIQQAAGGKVLLTFDGTVTSLVSSLAGGMVAYQVDDGAINLVDTSSFQPLPIAESVAQTATAVLGINEYAKYILVQSPAGPRLMTLTGRTIPLKGSNTLTNPVFSSDGKLFAAITPNGEVVVWDTTTITQPTSYALHFPNTTSLALNSTGKILAMGSSDGTIRLWDFVNGSQLGNTLLAHNIAIAHMLFSPTADILASATEEGKVMLWDLRARSLEARACALAGRSLTESEWADNLPKNLEYINTCALLKP